jgi:hypothetical protein
VLRAPWKKIVCTPVDISVKTRMTNELIDKVKGRQFAGGAIYRQVLAPARFL